MLCTVPGKSVLLIRPFDNDAQHVTQLHCYGIAAFEVSSVGGER